MKEAISERRKVSNRGGEAFDSEKGRLADKIIIVGYPYTGKTRFANHFFGDQVIHTDDYIDFGWDKCVDFIVEKVRLEEKWIIEGVQGFRIMRRMLQIDRIIPDLVVYLDPLRDALERHIAMRKGLDKIWHDCLMLNDGRVKIVHTSERILVT